jgi:hypothetical protein
MNDMKTLQLFSETPGFTIKNICGCRIVYGSVPISDVAMLTYGFSKNALMATDIADRIGATFVIGEPDDLDDLCRMNLPISDKRLTEHRAATQMRLDKVAAWLADGERGLSSEAMCKHIFGIPESAGKDHPHDPDDLRRCLLFLDATDAHDKVSLMQDVSEEWGRLVARWDDLVAVFKEEAAKGSRAPRTYALMKEILKGSF